VEPAPPALGSLVRRLVAFFLDGLIIVPVYLLYAIALDGLFGVLVEPGPAGELVVVAVNPGRVALELTLTLVTDAAYYAGCWAAFGTTPGQRLLGMVVRPVVDGTAAGAVARLPAAELGRMAGQAALTRWGLLQVIPLCVGTLAAAGAVPLATAGGINTGWYTFLFVTVVLHPQRRGLHDVRAGTVVLALPRRLRRA
jgi:uncharacterized RDD family membrane protein YckC